MSLIAPVENGKIVETASQESTSSSRKTGQNSVVDSDTFLTMLVAEMQNQDPLEPTSNTEWVAQYATFTMVEEMDEMGKSMDLMRANSLVGQNVIMKVTSESTGDTNYVQGVVDYVVYENGKAYLYIDDQAYSLDDLDTVASQDYMEAYNKSSDFVKEFAKLPTLTNLTKNYAEQVQNLWTMYDGMTDYQKGFVSDTYVTALKKYKTAMEDMGVTIKDAEPEITLNDLYNSFNSKIDTVLSNISGISTSVGGISTSVSGISSNVGTIATDLNKEKVSEEALDDLVTDKENEENISDVENVASSENEGHTDTDETDKSDSASENSSGSQTSESTSSSSTSESSSSSDSSSSASSSTSGSESSSSASESSSLSSDSSSDSGSSDSDSSDDSGDSDE